MKLNKENWKEVFFKDVTDCVENHVRDPLTNGLTKFIGLEHIEPENFKIATFESIENGTTFTKTFGVGDVLFGKRRAYLRKVAVADFEGLCSSDILVFRTKNGKLLSELLPFYVSSERFIQFAINTSAGSLSPRTKWRDIAQYKFFLPPKDVQERILEIFQRLEDTIKQAEQQERNLFNLKKQLLSDLFGDKRQFGNYLNESDFETVKFEQIAFNISERVEPQQTDYTIYVGLEHLDPDNLKIERKGKPEDVIGTKLKIYEGDIIFGKRRAYLRKVAVSDFEGICSAHSMVLRANEKMIEKGLLPFFMQSDVFMNRAVQISEGSLSPTIKWKVLANQEFIIPKREKQKQIAETFIHFDKVIEQIREQKQTLKNLKFKLLNEILG